MRQAVMGAVVLAALLAVVTGCQEKRKRPEIGQAEGDALQGRDVSGQSPQQAVGGSAKLYVDSVPPGADVYVVLADQPLEKDEAGNFKSRGKTPLILEIEQRRGAKVTILWNMKEYLAKVQELPAMKDWITRFTAPHPFGQSPLAAQEYFSFDSPGTSVVQSTANEILAVGPVYSLDDYPGNRLCAIHSARDQTVGLSRPHAGPRYLRDRRRRLRLGFYCAAAFPRPRRLKPRTASAAAASTWRSSRIAPTPTRALWSQARHRRPIRLSS